MTTPPRGTGEESPASPLADEVARLRSELTAANVRLAAVEGENAELRAADVCQVCANSIRRRIEAENGIATAERRGAERAAQYCQTTAVVRHGITDYKDMADELANEIRALFPPPGAEVGRG